VNRLSSHARVVAPLSWTKSKQLLLRLSLEYADYGSSRSSLRAKPPLRQPLFGS
jgi:hypothetical protein